MRAALTQSSPSPFPSPRLQDDEHVRWALSTGGALWLRGERSEALRWLRRAADRASALDDDYRTMELLRALDACFRSQSAPRSTLPDGDRPTFPPEPISPGAPPLRMDRASAGGSASASWAAPPLPSPARPSAEPPRSAKIARPALPPPRGPAPEIDEILEFEEAGPSWPPPRPDLSTARPPEVGAAPHSGEASALDAVRPSLHPMRHATRVAVTGVAGKTEVVALEPGGTAPQGSVVALLVALDGDDAAILRTLLGA